jgi:ribosomal protein S27AE
MELQDYWIYTSHRDLKSIFPKTCMSKFVRLNMPKQCPSCAKPVDISIQGNANRRSFLAETKCEHIKLISQVWDFVKAYNELCPQCGEVH